jgi:DNA polymerase-3 subunit gamma/tau
LSVLKTNDKKPSLTTENIIAENTENEYKKNPKSSEKKVEIKNPNVESKLRRNSALSLKSINKKSKQKKPVIDNQIISDNLPKDHFTNKQFQNLWIDYVENLNKKGEKIIASIMNADIPKIHEFKISLTLPNTMMKAEIIKIKPKLLKHFRERLNNFSLDIEIHVNEENTKKYAYTPQEKYDKLLEKNKALAKLKRTFKLDL